MTHLSLRPKTYSAAFPVLRNEMMWSVPCLLLPGFSLYRDFRFWMTLDRL